MARRSLRILVLVCAIGLASNAHSAPGDHVFGGGALATATAELLLVGFDPNGTHCWSGVVAPLAMSGSGAIAVLAS